MNRKYGKCVVFNDVNVCVRVTLLYVKNDLGLKFDGKNVL